MLPSKKVLFVVIVSMVAVGLVVSGGFSRTNHVYEMISSLTDNVNTLHSKLVAFGRDKSYKKTLFFQTLFEPVNMTADARQPGTTTRERTQNTATSRQYVKPNNKHFKDNKNEKISRTLPIQRKMPALPPKRLFQQTNGTLPTTRLVLTTTWNETEEKMLVHGNVLRTWKLWQPTVIPVLFSNDLALTSRALTNHWQVLPLKSVTCGKMPIMRDLFLHAMDKMDSVFYGYANSDILLSDSLKQTVSVISELELVQTTPLMMLVSRTNTNFSAGPYLDNVSNIDEFKSKGWPLKDGSADVFITNRLFPWKHVPDVVVGRVGIGMWIVSYARAMNVTVIDLSKTITAIHMTTKAGNYESHWKPNGKCNHEIYNKLGIKPPSWRCGFIQCAAMETNYGRQNGAIRLSGRNRFRYDPRCLECPMNLTSIGV